MSWVVQLICALAFIFFFLMIRRPPISTLTDTLFPYTTLFRSARHEDIAAVWLQQYFPAAVVEPVRLHVEAKRYLCRAEPAYWAGLSQGSKTSLDVQGGIHSEAAAATFIAQPHAADAVLLPRWDDSAKRSGEHKSELQSLMRSSYAVFCLHKK